MVPTAIESQHVRSWSAVVRITWGLAVYRPMYRIYGILVFVAVGAVAGIAVGWSFGTTGVVIGGAIGTVVGWQLEASLYRVDSRRKESAAEDGTTEVDTVDDSVGE